MCEGAIVFTRMFSEPSQPLHPTDPVLSKARLYPYFLEDDIKPACMLVLPGGGYRNVSHQEGPPVAGWFNAMGISAAVLEYTVNSEENGLPIYPQPQQQALYAMRYLRANADALNIDANRIGVIGFSAGGHLSACVTHGFDREDCLVDPDGTLDGVSARPDVAIHCYAVISSADYAHVSSFRQLLGSNVTEESADFLSWEKHVHADAPPSFIWHTVEDTTVPVENAYLLASALQKKKIQHEVHIFPNGAHGRGLGTIGDRRHSSVAQWTSLAQKWLTDLGF